MSYYMRYIIADERAVTLDDVERAFVAEEEEYRVSGAAAEGTIEYEGRTIAQVTINVPSDGLFEDELAELSESAGDGEGPGKELVLDTLARARTVLAIQVLFGDALEETLEALDPLWSWLQEHRRGLLQADGEGYYDASGLILELD